MATRYAHPDYLICGYSSSVDEMIYSKDSIGRRAGSNPQLCPKAPRLKPIKGDIAIVPSLNLSSANEQGSTLNYQFIKEEYKSKTLITP